MISFLSITVGTIVVLAILILSKTIQYEPYQIGDIQQIALGCKPSVGGPGAVSLHPVLIGSVADEFEGGVEVGLKCELKSKSHQKKKPTRLSADELLYFSY